MSKFSLNELITQNAIFIDQHILQLLPTGDDRLSQAMRYSALSPGKRIRPFILLQTAEIFDVPQEFAVRTAAAIEIIHSYSLIHDDLPAMDDDDFRRGIPSCHKKFDEATAILAGDALLTLAFEILVDEKTHPSSQIRCELVRILASSIGSEGIAGGQMLDLIYEKEIKPEYSQLVHAQYMKTATLFIACCEMAAVLGNADEFVKKHLLQYAKNFGLAFQFIDDLEDFSQDATINNNNIVQFIGQQQTLSSSKQFINSACQALSFFDEKKVTVLKTLAQNLISL